MSDPTTVYDLGEVKFDPPSLRSRPAKAARPAREMGRAASFEEPTSFDLPASLSLFVPGGGQMLRGELLLGAFFLSWLGFVVSLGWAVATTLERSVATLTVLGYPIAAGVWVLAGLYATAALLHVANLLTVDGTAGPVRAHAANPIVAGLASAVVPGWGQLLNGHRLRGAVFVAGLWVAAAAWVVSRPEVLLYLDGLGLYVPEDVLRLTGPPVRWTAPAVIWALAIYDAVTGASTEA